MSRWLVVVLALLIGTIRVVRLYAQVVTPDGASLTAAANTSGNLASFGVYNVMGFTQEIQLSCSGTGSVTGCSVDSPIMVGVEETATVFVTFSTGGAGTGNLILSAEGPGGSDDGFYVVTVEALSAVVTPDTGTLRVTPLTSGNSKAFTVANVSGTSNTYNLTTTCAGTASSCSVSPSSVTVGASSSAQATVTFSAGASGTSGSVTLRATRSGNPSDFDEGSVTVLAHYLTVSTAFNNSDHQNSALCAVSCFAATHAVSTVPYFSLDQPRSVTLVYNGDHLAARPFVFSDVVLQSGWSGFQEYWLEALDSTGAAFTFTNGDTKIRYVPALSAQQVRLIGQLDASLYPPGVFPVTLKVSAKYASVTETQTFASKFMVINERKSPIARGWTVAGLQRVYAQGDGALVTDGSGSGVFFKSCGTGCFTAPQGDFSVLSSSGSGTGLTYLRRYPDSSRAEFNHVGRLTRLISRIRDTVTFEYDGTWRLTRIYDPYRTNGAGAHLYTSLAYGSYGLSSIQEPGPNYTQAGGRSTSITVTSDSTLTQFTDPDAVSRRFVYDSQRRLQAIVNRRGDTATIAYNAVTWKVDSVLSPRIELDPRLYGTNQFGRLVTKFRPWQSAGMPMTSTVSSAATPTTVDSASAWVTDVGGHRLRFVANRWGQPVREVDADERTRIAYLSAVSGILPDSIRSILGGVTHFTYSGPFQTSSRSPGQTVANVRYGAYGQVDSVWGNGRVPRRFFLGSYGRVDSVRTSGDALKVRRLTYDSRQRVVSDTDPGNHTTQFHYEPVFGNLDSTLVPGSRFSRRRFDRYGRDSASSSTDLPWSRVTRDALNRVTESYNGVIGAPTALAYDAVNLVRVQDAKGQVYRFSYNAIGNMTRRYDPADTLNRFESFAYNSEGLLSTVTNRRGNTVERVYDALHRMRAKGGTNTVADSFAYSDDGRIRTAWNSVSRDSTFYAASGWVDSVVTRLSAGANRFRRYYRPDSIARLDSAHVTSNTSIIFAARRLVWKNATGALDSLVVEGAPATQSFNTDMQRSSSTLPGGVTRSESWTTAHQGYRESFTPNGPDTLLWRHYNYNTRGQIEEDYRKGGSVNGYKYKFRYDSLGQLRKVEDYWLQNFSCSFGNANFGGPCNAQTQTLIDTARYEYDAVGNLIYAKAYSSSDSLRYDIGNRITSSPGLVFEYDLDGNTTRRRAASGTGTDVRFYWSAENRLDSVRAGTVNVRYEYNADGQLVRRSLNGTPDRHFLWDGDNLLAELNGSADLRRAEYAYYPGIDEPFALITGSTTIAAKRFYHEDGRGNVWGVLSQTGNVVAQTLHTPWGEFWGGFSGIADTSRLGWKALMWEGDSTRLYYVRNRWYDPWSRRFMSEDPIGLEGGVNLYLFASNDPILGQDPYGLIRLDDLLEMFFGGARSGRCAPSFDARGRVTSFCTGATGQVFDRTSAPLLSQELCPNDTYAYRCNEIRARLTGHVRNPLPECRQLAEQGLARYDNRGSGGRYYYVNDNIAWGASLADNVILYRPSFTSFFPSLGQNRVAFTTFHEEYHQYLSARGLPSQHAEEEGSLQTNWAEPHNIMALSCVLANATPGLGSV